MTLCKPPNSLSVSSSTERFLLLKLIRSTLQITLDYSINLSTFKKKTHYRTDMGNSLTSPLETFFQFSHATFLLPYQFKRSGDNEVTIQDGSCKRKVMRKFRPLLQFKYPQKIWQSHSILQHIIRASHFPKNYVSWLPFHHTMRFAWPLRVKLSQHSIHFAYSPNKIL